MEAKDYLEYLTKKYHGRKIDVDNIQFKKYLLTIQDDDIRIGSLTYKNETYLFNYTHFKFEESEKLALKYIEQYLRD
jgi:hypothetical protein